MELRSRSGRALARWPVGFSLACIRGFPLRARLGVAVAPFPAPATSHVACGFPALRAPAHFTPRVMGLSGWSDCRGRRMIRHAVPRKESQRIVQPFPAPPLPAETSTLARPSQMSPNLLFYPVSDVGETPARVADREVLHPTAQDRVDLLDHAAHGLGARDPEPGARHPRIVKKTRSC